MVACLGLMACQSTSATMSPFAPKPEEMRKALLTMLHDRPETDIPEFRTSLEEDTPVSRNGIVFIGSWNCDPKLMTFEAVFTSPNISMFEVTGRFEKDNRGVWMAIPRRVETTTKHDVDEFWRPHEVDARRI